MNFGHEILTIFVALVYHISGQNRQIVKILIFPKILNENYYQILSFSFWMAVISQIICVFLYFIYLFRVLQLNSPAGKRKEIETFYFYISVLVVFIPPGDND